MVDIIRSAEEVRQMRRQSRGKPLVLVPTMGALHDGHLSLVRLGLEFGQVIVSIFVNPTQFAPGEDYQTYPRTIGQDLDLLEPLGVSAVFAPELEQMYARQGGVQVQPGLCAQGLCGEKRPGHFAGVLTVVAKLFGIIQPDVAVFGRKDAQQCLVIQEMVSDLKMPVRMIDGHTVRESTGLAMSSRNRYLSPQERTRAGCLYKALQAGRKAVEEGLRDRIELEKTIRDNLTDVDSIDYVEIHQVPGMETTHKLDGRILLAVAAVVGPTRLIDNIVLKIDGKNVSESYLLGNGRTK